MFYLVRSAQGKEKSLDVTPNVSAFCSSVRTQSSLSFCSTHVCGEQHCVIVRVNVEQQEGSSVGRAY